MTPRADLEHRPLDEPDFQAAVEYFEANRKRIAKKCAKRWVAVLSGKVIDSDEDFGNLRSRVRDSFPGRHPYIAYANALNLEEMAEQFKIDGEIDWKRIREEVEADAADEMIRRMHENMKYNLNG